MQTVANAASTAVASGANSNAVAQSVASAVSKLFLCKVPCLFSLTVLYALHLKLALPTASAFDLLTARRCRILGVSFKNSMCQDVLDCEASDRF